MTDMPTPAERVAAFEAQIAELQARVMRITDEREALDQNIVNIRTADRPPQFMFLTPAGIGDEEYPTTGFARINSEIVRFSRAVGSDIMTVVARAQYGTELATHGGGDTVQLCAVYDDERIDVVMEDLLTEYGNVGAHLIDTDGWNDEAECWLLGHRVDGIVSEPTGVTTLLGELSRIGPYIWWDERDQLVKLRAQRPELNLETTDDLTDSNAILPGGSTKDLSDERITQLYLYFAQVDAAGSATSVSNFSRLRVHLNIEAERINEYGDSKVATIPTRWIPRGRDDLAAYVAAQLALRTRYTPVEIEVEVDVSRRELWVGDIVRLSTALIQDDSGEPITDSWLIVSAEEDTRGDRIRYRMRRSDYSRLAGSVQGRYAFVAADDAPDFADATDAQKAARGAWISGDDGLMADGSPPWVML